MTEETMKRNMARKQNAIDANGALDRVALSNRRTLPVMIVQSCEYMARVNFVTKRDAPESEPSFVCASLDDWDEGVLVEPRRTVDAVEALAELLYGAAREYLYALTAHTTPDAMQSGAKEDAYNAIDNAIERHLGADFAKRLISALDGYRS